MMTGYLRDACMQYTCNEICTIHCLFYQTFTDSLALALALAPLLLHYEELLPKTEKVSF